MSFFRYIVIQYPEFGPFSDHNQSICINQGLVFILAEFNCISQNPFCLFHGNRIIGPDFNSFFNKFLNDPQRRELPSYHLYAV